MTADGVEKFEIANVVGFFVLIVLNDENADGRGRSFERNAEPCGRRGANEFYFVAGGKAIEFRLRNQHGSPGPKDESGAGAAYFLWSRRGIELVREEREVERIGLRIMKSDEAVLRVQNFFERLVDA